MTGPGPVPRRGRIAAAGGYRHLALALSTLAATGSTTVHMGVPLLIPALVDSGLPLATAGLIGAMPAAGIVLTLIAWGWFVDRFGERAAMSLGLAATAAATAAAAASAGSGTAALAGALLLAGCGAASVNSASGRVVSGWYPPARRGTAMGVRQMAQPLGAALSAAALPALAARHGIGGALAAAAGLCALLAAACLVGIVDPPRPAAGSAGHAAARANPYRGSGARVPYLVRIHLSSAMLSWPQSMMGSMFLVWLLARGFSGTAAAAVVISAQLAGAASRALMGLISDRVRSRLRPYRAVAAATLVLAAAAAALDAAGAGAAAAAVLGLLAVSAVSPNGLALTAVAEYCGPLWSGRGMGAQNTFQNVVYAATPPLAGLVVAAAGFPALFALSAAFPAAALLISPRSDERGRATLR